MITMKLTILRVHEFSSAKTSRRNGAKPGDVGRDAPCFRARPALPSPIVSWSTGALAILPAHCMDIVPCSHSAANGLLFSLRHIQQTLFHLLVQDNYCHLFLEMVAEKTPMFHCLSVVG